MAINHIDYNCGQTITTVGYREIIFGLRKDKKVTFEDDMTNMKNEMNHNLLAQTFE